MMKQGGLKRKSKAASEIPSSSLADMAFLLLIFFMVSTTFRKEKPLPITIPDAEATKKLDVPRKDILHIWVEQNGDVFINDSLIPMENVSNIVAPMKLENPQLTVVLRADAEVPYVYIDGVQQELRQANSLFLTFYTSVEQRLQRERR
jgi:biopolymer transport protein ExbD